MKIKKIAALFLTCRCALVSPLPHAGAHLLPKQKAEHKAQR